MRLIFIPFATSPLILSPRENLLLHTSASAPSMPVELWASRIDGSQQRKLLELEPSPTQQTFTGMSFSKDGQWLAFTRGGGPTAVKFAKNEGGRLEDAIGRKRVTESNSQHTGL